MFPLLNRTFQVIVHGCRTNQYEGEAIASILEKQGARYSDAASDFVVFVTCTITAVADRKCRKQIRRLRRENKNAVIAVCGCYVQKMTKEEQESLNIDICVGNRNKYHIPRLLAEVIQDRKKTYFDVEGDICRTDVWDDLRFDRPRMHTRAFLKVQDGCDHYCSYCIVPYVRGKPVSRGFDESLEEARRIVSSGCPEIVLTGIHLGLYERLPELVRRIGAIEGLERLRFGSLEPFAVNEKLLDALAETPVFCPHLHLPLQSGDDEVLSAMRRGYTTAEFASIAVRAREKLGERLHISTDLMVAFPTEDEKAFENSLGFLREMRFGKVHVFPYSMREGTRAAQFEQVPANVAQERAKRALELASQLHEEYSSSWIGKEVSVLVDDVTDNVFRGLTPYFIRVAGLCPDALPGTETIATPVKYKKEILFCEGLEKNTMFDESIANFL